MNWMFYIILVTYGFQRKFLLITDCQNDGSFLIHHFLSLYIKGGWSDQFRSLQFLISIVNDVSILCLIYNTHSI